MAFIRVKCKGGIFPHFFSQKTTELIRPPKTQFKAAILLCEPS